MEIPDDFREPSPPLAGLRTLLEKVRLGARYSEAAKCSAELRVKKLDDLHLEGVWKALSTNLQLDFVENERLRLQCADETKLRGYAANDSGPSFNSDSDQAPTPNSPGPGESANPLDAAASRASPSISTRHGHQSDDDPRRHAVGAHSREIITLCIEGDYSAFDEERERRLRKSLACELAAELSMDQIKFVKSEISAMRTAHIGTKRCRLKVKVEERGYASYSSDSQTSDDEGPSGGGSSSRSPLEQIERDIHYLIASRHWPCGVEVIDIEVVWKGEGSVLLLLALPVPTGLLLTQLAQQRIPSLLSEGVRCCKYGRAAHACRHRLA
jgi:hypothetical protein